MVVELRKNPDGTNHYVARPYAQNENKRPESADRESPEPDDEKLAEIEQQLQFCEIKSPTEGVLVYAKKKDKQIEEGGSVHFKQDLFSIPSSKDEGATAGLPQSRETRESPAILKKVPRKSRENHRSL